MHPKAIAVTKILTHLSHLSAEQGILNSTILLKDLMSHLSKASHYGK